MSINVLITFALLLLIVITVVKYSNQRLVAKYKYSNQQLVVKYMLIFFNNATYN
jgi:hypothetical protein